MKPPRPILRPLAVALTLALVSHAAQAISLGEPIALSRIGEPLRITIPLMDSVAEELAAVRLHMASAAGYARSHIQMQPWMQRATIVIDWRKGKPFANISAEAQQDAIVDMVLEIEWPAGRMLQTVSVMLDPATGSIAAPVVSPVISPAIRVARAEIATMTPSAAHVVTVSAAVKQTQPAPQSSPAEDPVEVPRTLTVKGGDTLSSLSRPLATEGISVEQVMAGLFQNNAHAFIGGNMNLIKAGSRLKAPTRKQIKNIDPETAHQAIRGNISDFSGHRKRVVESVASKDDVAAKKPEQSASGRVAVIPLAEPTAPRTADKLTLSAPGVSRGSANSTGKVASAGKSLEEDLIATKKALDDERSRAAELALELKESRLLLEAKSRLLEARPQSEKTSGAIKSTGAALSPPTTIADRTSTFKLVLSYLAALAIGLGVARFIRRGDSSTGAAGIFSEVAVESEVPAQSDVTAPDRGVNEAEGDLDLARIAIEMGDFPRARTLLLAAARLGDASQAKTAGGLMTLLEQQ